jgi:hypothetical protein
VAHGSIFRDPRRIFNALRFDRFVSYTPAKEALVAQALACAAARPTKRAFGTVSSYFMLPDFATPARKPKKSKE